MVLVGFRVTCGWPVVCATSLCAAVVWLLSLGVECLPSCFSLSIVTNSVNDASCHAFCECEDGWAGSGCEASAAELAHVQDVMNSIMSAQVKALSIIQLSSTAVDQLGSALSSVASNPSQVRICLGSSRDIFLGG